MYETKARPEGSIVEAFVMNEMLTFYSLYQTRIKMRFNRNKCNDDRILHNEVYGKFQVFKLSTRPLDRSTLSTLLVDEKRSTH